jgi:hypothetical protein
MDPSGKVTDSALIELFFHSRKREMLRDLSCSENRRIEAMLRGYASVCNPMPRHSPHGSVAPASCEKQPA